MKKQIERRFLRQEFRVSGDGEAPKISGYGAVFNSPSENLGWFQEVREEIDPQAFDSVMAGKHDVRGLFNHDGNFVLGRESAGTLQLSVDGRGLAYEIDPPDTQWARDLMVSMRRGDIKESSFAFSVKRDQWTDNADGSVTRRILEFDELFDVSPVTYPAYPAASAQARTLPATMPAEMRARFGRRDMQDGDGDCTCPCQSCQGGDCDGCACDGCDSETCGNDTCACAGSRSRRSGRRSDPKMKTVDGEALTADCFLIVGDPEDPETWHLPWKFSTEEKIKSHLRDALSRFDQVEGVSEAAKKTAWAKLLRLCKEHDIEVSEDDRGLPSLRELRVRLAMHLGRL